ncbi:MAG: mechanosensitive ion channel family protein [Bdellovibrionales bacterium]|nr:mechanosensitive ion channel family protein [Bdellovibrionales bacterium]
MPNQTSQDINPFALNLPELSLKVASFLEIGTFILIASLVYFLLRKALKMVKNAGLIQVRGPIFKTLNIATIAIPSFIFFYGLTLVSRESLFVSLLFFVIFSIVIGFSLVDPIRALFAASIISLRGDLQVGDYVHLGIIEGRILKIGAFNIVVQTKSGSKTFIPTHQFMQQSYEIHSSKGGPSVTINISDDHLSKSEVELLGQLCPYRRQGSDIRLTTQDGIHKIHLEVINRDARSHIIKYFEVHGQKS